MSESSRERPLRMVADRSVLVLVDYQTKLMPAIHDQQTVLARAELIGKTAGLVGVDVIGTAQYPERLGANVPEIASLCGAVVEKRCFGAFEDGLDAELTRRERERAGSGQAPDDVVIAGCEAHVCLAQTALGLLEAGRTVWVVQDACGSRRPSDAAAAMRRLAAAGAQVVTSEMVVFEWLHDSRHDRFREASALVKQVPVD